MPRAGVRKWHDLLLSDERVSRWYRNLARRNATTADVYLRRLARTLDGAKGLSPVDLLELSQEDLDDMAMDCIDYELARGMLGSTAEGFRKALASFLAWHSKELKRPLHIPGAHEAPNAEGSLIPEPESLAATLASANVRTAAMVSLIAFGGLRLQVIGKIDASDGLVLGDLPELEITGDRVSFTNVPTLVRVRRQLSKNRKPYLTFLGLEGCHYLRAYLQWRLHQGEKLTAKSPLVSPYGGQPRFTLRNNVGDAIRRAMRPNGIQEPPYIWRSYFGNRCLMAESKGLPASFRKFFMGHSGGIQGRYALEKQIPEDMVEEMRQAYAKALPFLETGHAAEEDPVPEMVELFLQVTGMDEEAVKALDLASKPKEEQVRLLQEALQLKAVTKVQQRVVGLDQMEACLSEGWLFKASLPDNRIIMEMA